MQGKAVVAGLGKYLKHLVKLLILPWLLVSLFNVAKRHQDTDSKAVPKYVLSVIIGAVLLGGSVVKTVEFHGDNIDGMYDTLDNRLSVLTGSAAYEEAVNTNDAELMAKHEEGHEFYLVLSGLVSEKNDEAARALLATNDEFAEKGLEYFDHKDKGVAQFGQFMDLFVYPGLVGLFFAPILFVMARIINSAWVPSESVGFKPYPGTSGALFLVLGAFGIPATLFAAWAFMDVEDRSREGQISL
ncbi:MAG: hypothetical protein ACPHK8_05860 [Thermoplasmatota archaeon]